MNRMDTWEVRKVSFHWEIETVIEGCRTIRAQLDKFALGKESVINR